MNKLDKVFTGGSKNKLNVFFTAGYPQLESMGEIILALQKYGTDIIEIGMPYSDPIADGPIIQHSNSIALKNGMNMQILLAQLNEIKNLVNVPLVLMGYLNPVLQYGIEKFCSDAAQAGVSAVIIPDLPMFEYEKYYKAMFEKFKLHFIFLISPETSPARIKKADKLSRGFLYAVSSTSTTGEKTMGKERINWYERIKKLKLKNPVLVGFGIKEKKDFDMACLYADGAIIGTAFISALQHATNLDGSTRKFIENIKDVNYPA